MKKNKSIYLILTNVMISISLMLYSTFIYFSIGFDAGDNMWPFTRYFMTSYKHIALFSLILVISLFVTMFMKNILVQSQGRVLVTAELYILKFLLVITLIDSLSLINTVKYSNLYNAQLPISLLITPLCTISVVLNILILIREL